MCLNIIVTHIAGTGFNVKSLLKMELLPEMEPQVRELLVGKKGLSPDQFDGLLSTLRVHGTVENLGYKGYRKGMTLANPNWPCISVRG